MRHFIAHSKPTITPDQAKAVCKVIQTGQLAQGRQVKAFESKFARFQNVKWAAATSSGTSALHLALLALNVKKGDQVIIPSYVCTALLNAVHYVGAQARIVDVGYDDFNISAVKVKKKINAKTKAIIVAHMFGLPADISALSKLGVPLIEDCAQSIGATYKRKKAGSFAALSIYSFYATKMMTTAEGGMVTSKSQQLINRIKDLRDYDEKQDYKVRFNYKMTDIQAALGINQLAKLPAWIKRRKEIAKKYNQAFQDCGFVLPVEDQQKKHVYFRYVVKVKKDRDKLVKYLKSKGIQCAAPVYKPLHRYVQLKGFGCTDRLMKESVSLPIYPSLSNNEVKYIIQSVKYYFR